VEESPVKPSSGPINDRRTSFRGLLINSPEGHVLVSGLALLLIYMILLVIQLTIDPTQFQTLIGMTAIEVVFGRIACMAFGYSMGIPQYQIILISIFLETILVLIFYPLFVFIWQQLLMIRWLKRFSDRTRKTAETHKGKVHKYGIIGLFMFVWLPFWMTGPVVGCMIGYLLRMRIWINLITVLSGTYIAILGWAYLLNQLHKQQLSFGSYTFVVIAAITAAVILARILRRRFRRASTRASIV
jgi:uncharacterized membrane protein